MSWCPIPRDCLCEGSDENNLKCGPCQKCLKRSLDMHSTWNMDIQPIRQMRGSGSYSLSTKIYQVMLSVLLVIQIVLSVSFRQFKKIMIGLCPSPILCAYQSQSVNITSPSNERIGIDGWVNDVKCLLGKGVCQVQHWYNKVEWVRSAKSFTPWCQGYSPIELKKLQSDDPELYHVIKWMGVGKRPESKEVCPLSPSVHHYWNYWHTLEYVDGLLFKRYHKQDDTGTYLQIVVPGALKEHVLKSMLNTVLQGIWVERKQHRNSSKDFIGFKSMRMWICGSLNVKYANQLRAGARKLRHLWTIWLLGHPLTDCRQTSLVPYHEQKGVALAFWWWRIASANG